MPHTRGKWNFNQVT